MASGRTIFLKQSGERLNQGAESGYPWYAEDVQATGKKLAFAYHAMDELAITGLTVVSGAGNIARGKDLRDSGIAPKRADFLGRLGTIQNTEIILETLEAMNVPATVFLANRMRLEDESVKLEPYSVDRMHQAHEEGRVVLIAGGTGQDGVTTDNAVVTYARQYHQNFGGEVTILKGTKFDGVFNGDPKKQANARCYKKISARYMLKHYEERFTVVDKQSLEELIKSNLSMLVYADGEYDFETILRHDPRNNGTSGESIGTVIVPESTKAIYYG